MARNWLEIILPEAFDDEGISSRWFKDKEPWRIGAGGGNRYRRETPEGEQSDYPFFDKGGATYWDSSTDETIDATDKLIALDKAATEAVNRAADFKRRRNMFELTPEEQDTIIMTPLEQEMYW